MSDVFFGVIKHAIDSPYEEENLDKYIDFLHTIQKIAIEQRLTIWINGIQSNDLNDADYYKCIPDVLKEDKQVFTLVISRAPYDITADELFNDWQVQAWRETYIPGQDPVFKQLENLIEQVFALDEVKSLWLRYQCMFACDVNKLATFTHLEEQIYKQCSSSSTFEVSDFEISLEKNTVNNTPSL